MECKSHAYAYCMLVHLCKTLAADTQVSFSKWGATNQSTAVLAAVKANSAKVVSNENDESVMKNSKDGIIGSGPHSDGGCRAWEWDQKRHDKSRNPPLPSLAKMHQMIQAQIHHMNLFTATE